jgi:hypothetical protein
MARRVAHGHVRLLILLGEPLLIEDHGVILDGAPEGAASHGAARKVEAVRALQEGAKLAHEALLDRDLEDNDVHRSRITTCTSFTEGVQKKIEPPLQPKENSILAGPQLWREVLGRDDFSLVPRWVKFTIKDQKKLKDRSTKGEVFAYVGLPQNLKDLKDQSINAFSAVLFTERRIVRICWANQNLKNLKDQSTTEINENCSPTLRGVSQ